MKVPRKKLRTALACALCAAALTLSLPVWAAESVKTPEGVVGTAQAVVPGADLFYGYMLRRAGASNDAVLLSDAASRLEDAERTTCEALKPMIAEVASGARTSTVLPVTYTGFRRWWTAEELGVDGIVEGNHILEAAKTALLNEMRAYFVELNLENKEAPMGKSTQRIVSALISDCPYELYWFDGTQGYASDLSDAFFRFTAQWRNGEYVIAPDVPGDGETVDLVYEFRFSVSPDYGEGTEMNPELPARIDAALDAAAAIVKKYADKSDYEKMLGYSTEICALVEYDDAAADDGTGTPYGDPWQLISVFDGDPDTNVVCEGYSKAFKYLCDLSSFDAENVECRIVTGVLDGGTGAGAHMWNVVTMENGKNYLVDVTNSDNSHGAAYLLLKGGSPDNADASQYTFYDDMVFLYFLYDEETVDLWGADWLTLDTADYEPPEPSEPSASLTLGGYALSAAGKAVSMDDLRGGAEISVTKEDSEAEENFTLYLVSYSAGGRMESAQSQELKLSQSSGTFQTQALPDGAAYAKFIAVDESLLPLASVRTPD